ncbi:hypothetical protein F2Q69_00030362 [Brassica cretica]|uniref:Uncharacterized protein n=1 Tax=Brassica cretica TaxID=69181 RepID=A0A8S9RUJ5_BRACR|nr:hypothetical protein F2Q69_00030362 [Brassica cretica]
MSSRKKGSTKSRRDRSVPDCSNLQHDDAAPKVEFAEHSVNPEEAEAYWAARGELKPPRCGTWAPPLFRADPVEAGEVDGSPPEGYITSYEAYVMQCHLWFPIPGIAVQLFDRYKLPISQVNPFGLQHIVGILVLSYEMGMTLDADHLEAMLQPLGNLAIVQLRPQMNMTIISGFLSNFHDWKDHFFFVRVNDTSVEAGVIPIFRTRWGRKVTNPLPPTPDGLRTVRYLLLSGSSFWALFTPKRVRRAVALHHFWFRPDLPVEEGAESSMDGFVLYVALAERERSRPRKDKHVIVDDDVAVGQGYPTENILKQGLLMINRALNVSNQEACMALFKAEMADKLFLMQASVSPDTVESERGVPDETGQVNQPTVPLDVTDYSMGGIDDWVL